VRKPLVAAVFLLALALSAPAFAAVVPGQAQAQIKQVLGLVGGSDFAYVPTYLPKGYSYASFNASTTGNEIQIQSAKLGPEALLFSVSPTARKASGCGKGSVGTARYGGVTVFLASRGAWRCLRAPSGHIVVVTVVGPGLSVKEAGHVAASATRVR
jgi:hypothetical protein